MKVDKNLKKFEMVIMLKEKGKSERNRIVIQIEAIDKLEAIDKISRLINKPIPRTVNIKEVA
jgi:Ni,Fe-hydrogenase maturation factor